MSVATATLEDVFLELVTKGGVTCGSRLPSTSASLPLLPVSGRLRRHRDLSLAGRLFFYNLLGYFNIGYAGHAESGAVALLEPHRVGAATALGQLEHRALAVAAALTMRLFARAPRQRHRRTPLHLPGVRRRRHRRQIRRGGDGSTPSCWPRRFLTSALLYHFGNPEPGPIVSATRGLFDRSRVHCHARFLVFGRQPTRGRGGNLRCGASLSSSAG